jgi:hypothetical protein
MALTIALALDPMAGLGPPRPPAAATTPNDATQAASEPVSTQPDPDDVPPGLERAHDAPSVPAPVRGDRLGFHTAAGAFGAAWLLPDLTGGADVLVGLDISRVRVDLEGDVALPASTTAPGGGGVRASLTLGAVSACFLPVGALRLCALAAAGALRGEGTSVALVRHGSSFYAAAGGRVAVEIPLPLYPRIAVDLRADGMTPLSATTLGLGDADVWTTPPLSVSLGAGLAAHFP